METQYKEKEGLKKLMLPVTGMTCAACANSVENIISRQPGVIEASVNFANESAKIQIDPEITSPENIREAVRTIGYDLLLDNENQKEILAEIKQNHTQNLKRNIISVGVLTLPTVAIGMFFMDIPYANWIMFLLTLPVILFFGKSFFINAYKQARIGKANMDTLVAVSTGIAFVFSLFNTFNPEFWHSRGLHPHVYFESVSVVIFFVMLGKLLEEKAKSNTSTAIQKLVGLQPSSVIIIENGEEKLVELKSVKAGDKILIRPGDKIPVDGKVVSGNSFIDESMISGEPIPVEKTKGENVYAGTLNQQGSFRFVAQKVGEDTFLANIIRMVQEAQGSKAPVQKLVDKIAGIFVPIVLGISILTFITWIVIGGENAITHALLASVTVLVIACPCALGLATPTAIMVGVGKGAENGILIKDAESLELAQKVDSIILDKTGTITEGKPQVTSMSWAGNPDNLTAKSILLSIESQSTHPLAEAVVRKMKEEHIDAVNIRQIINHPGKGVESEYLSEKYFIGNPNWMKTLGFIFDENQVKALQNQANTVILFGKSREILAILAISDPVKASSFEAIKTLKELNIEVYMLTGDNKLAAEKVAEQVGIDYLRAEVLPSEKADFVKSLQEKGKIVAMVGDGINDSQALAQADVSIAMGKGSDIAMEVAKITLISSNLQAIPKALKISKLTVSAVRENLFWAFIYNLIGIPLAAGILYPVNGFLLNPMIAGAAMALSSVSVVLNSLRIKYRNI
ncbi:Cu2+-exporting ATPase [Pseudarcicella hirudinis]|uniref:P-type Cu(+) transporter n=1 Tax=Pseudarcicella hirudinis TaxID=1079859 RepID=A0A1I5MIN0_9BACT|nr:heavy metal translocating P-type ATPase [Pseudarcicella hirudinis]SFP09442.1 Cu2+-exporting ATPase [Pseudarcicella hirudinis]